MIKHIVMWKLKEENREENINSLKKMLESLKTVISQIKKIEAGINICKSPNSCDIVLYSEFETMDSLSVYQKHPEHIKVADFLKEITEERYVVDFEI